MTPRPAPQARNRSPFAAAFLSFVFPGLGQLYAGAPQRALLFATPAILALALTLGLILRADRFGLLGFVIQPSVLTAILVVNLAVLAYRVVAVLDAYRVAAYQNAALGGGTRLGRPRLAVGPVSIAGLIAVLAVLSLGHVALARYDLQAMELVNCIFDESGTASCDEPTDGTAAASPDASASTEPSPSATSAGASASPDPSATPAATLPPWDGKERLNMLLIGSDQRPKEGAYNTDTLIVVSIDPATGQVAMFSLPRDTVDVPVPPGPARSLFGRTYAGKINSWFTDIRNREGMFPGNDRQRGYNGLKAIMGELYGVDIRWFVEVNFEGFKKVIDALGGVTVNVQIPVVDDRFPGDEGLLTRVYIPTGIQHMNGSQALQYARSRHTSTDFDRGARQQRILLSLREQTDAGALLPRLDSLVGALKSAVKTDIPVAELPRLLALADTVDTKSVRSFVFAPPTYQEERRSGDPRGYVIVPYVDKIRAAVSSAFDVSPAVIERREALSEEGATVRVLNGSGKENQASRIAGYLEYHGISASAPNQKPDTRGQAATIVRVYNGAEARIPRTIAFLEAVFDVVAEPVADPTMTTDVLVITGTQTKDIKAPSGP
jgi:LCP family protein required for cell wall assembly